MQNHYRCRICGASDYFVVMEGSAPLAADIRECPSKDAEKYPICVVRCGSCGHIQLRESVEADLYSQYLFTPSYTTEFADYMKTFCRRLNDVLGLGKRRSVLEIGSSNGCLLKILQDEGWDVLGIEPSAPMVEAARQKGVNTIRGYFEEAVTEDIKAQIGTPSVIILRHVLEHLDHLDEIISLIQRILGDGLLVIEVPYVQKAIRENRFYDFFHEHLSYFSVTALDRLLRAGGFTIHHVYETPEVGGSILIFADGDNTMGLDNNAKEYYEDEKDSLSAERVAAFSNGIAKHVSQLRVVIKDAKTAGKTVAGWGAGQRGCTLIAACEFQSNDLRYVIDANENYWWRYVPGTDIQIVPPEYYRAHMVDEMLIFATGYADSIIGANREFERLGGHFVRISAI